MDIANTSFFGILRERLSQLSERQRLIAENIANASTPGYQPRDLDASAFQRMLDTQSGGVRLARTNAGHMTPGGGPGAAQIVTRPDSETTLDGNSVVLEEQTVRATETRMQYETALALYQKGLQLMRMASRPPGR
ncbi:MAG: flagellar basal body rod protein FlgB [Hyphomonadaceae bacterium]